MPACVVRTAIGGLNLSIAIEFGARRELFGGHWQMSTGELSDRPSLRCRCEFPLFGGAGDHFLGMSGGAFCR